MNRIATITPMPSGELTNAERTTIRLFKEQLLELDHIALDPTFVVAPDSLASPSATLRFHLIGSSHRRLSTGFGKFWSNLPRRSGSPCRGDESAAGLS